MAEEKERMDRQILEQYDVKGMQNPRFALGGGTPGDPRSADQMAGFRQAMKLDTRAGMMALDHPQFADMFNKMTPEEIEMLKAKKDEITAQAQGIRGQGLGPALELFSGLDLSFIKPLRERAGVSKGDLTDWTLDTLGVEGAARTGAKTAAWFKEYEHGGPTGPRYEAEGGEMIQHAPNDLPRTYGAGGVSRITPTESEITGPSHAQGGVPMSDDKGARIYSDKLKVDSALMAKLSKL